MNRILIPIDGSPSSLAAAEYAVRLAKADGSELHVVNVQPPLPSAVTTFLSGDVVAGYHDEQAERELVTAREALNTSGVPFHVHKIVGRPAECITEVASRQGCSQIVMGSRGLSAFSGVVLGSVATRVIHLAKVPVTLVK
jgi:nucleotide-binding universal stress UspA family protein